MSIIGLRDTSNFVVDQRPKNWRAGVLMLYPNGDTPLFGLTAAMRSEAADDPEYSWWEKAMDDRRVVLSADITNVATTIGVTAGAQTFKQGDVLRVEEHGELVRVSADPSSDTSLTVVRGVAGTTAAAVTVASENPHLIEAGSAYEEASLAPTGINYDPVKKYNYMQIFRNTLEVSRTAMKTRLRTGDAVKEAKRECLEYHSAAIERALWFGSRHEGTLNGKPHRYTGGVLSFIPAGNTEDYSANTLSIDELEELMYNIFIQTP